MKVIKFSQRELDKIYNRAFLKRKSIEEKVRRILDDVRREKDRAVVRYTKRFDKVDLKVGKLRVGEKEINGAYQDIDSELIEALKDAIRDITVFCKHQARKSWKMRGADGAVLGQRYNPIEKVGIYVPSGSAPLISTVYMTVIPARVAGVKEITLTTPPDEAGNVNAYILAVANLLKVNKIYKIGGAQAIGALAFGTESVDRVDKIVGPGNVYVTEAKRQVFGYVGVDMIAGPSEVAIIANQYTNPEFVKADLKAQAEHAMGISILITPSKTLIKAVKDEIRDGYIIKVKNLERAVEIANRIAPEHLQIMVKSPGSILKKITNAGAIFVGSYTPTAVGDYVAGPSHVLPTSGTARFFSGLGVEDFTKRTSVISYTKKALERSKKAVEKLSSVEGLTKHTESIQVRFK